MTKRFARALCAAVTVTALVGCEAMDSCKDGSCSPKSSNGSGYQMAEPVAIPAPPPDMGATPAK